MHLPRAPAQVGVFLYLPFMNQVAWLILFVSSLASIMGGLWISTFSYINIRRYRTNRRRRFIMLILGIILLYIGTVLYDMADGAKVIAYR